MAACTAAGLLQNVSRAAILGVDLDMILCQKAPTKFLAEFLAKFLAKFLATQGTQHQTRMANGGPHMRCLISG